MLTRQVIREAASGLMITGVSNILSRPGSVGLTARLLTRGDFNVMSIMKEIPFSIVITMYVVMVK